MKRKNIITKIVSTKITQNDFDKIQNYASERGMSQYEATRELLLYGLKVKEKESRDMVSVIENLKEELREDMKITTDTIMKRLDTLADGKRIDDVEGELLRYLQQILYHGFRTDMWNIEYAKKMHKDNFAHALDKKVEDLTRKHSE